MTKALIFDADGMIVHGERLSSRLANEHSISLETTSHFFDNAFQQCVVGEADLKEELAKCVDEWGWQGGVDALLSYWFADEHNKIDERFEPIIRALRARGMKAYLATNNERYRADDLTKRRGLGNWFDAVFSSGYVGAKKPEEAFFARIFKETGHAKEEVVFWDDDLENIRGAATLGIPVQLYTDFDAFCKTLESVK